MIRIAAVSLAAVLLGEAWVCSVLAGVERQEVVVVDATGRTRVHEAEPQPYARCFDLPREHTREFSACAMDEDRKQEPAWDAPLPSPKPEE